MLKELVPEKIAIALSKETVTFFREKAEELDAPYQRMIRNLLDIHNRLTQRAPTGHTNALFVILCWNGPPRHYEDSGWIRRSGR